MPPISPTARTWFFAWLAVLAVLVLAGNTYNHVPAGLWLLLGVIAGTLYAETRRSG